MSIYGIYACESRYGGLHGIFNCDFLDLESDSAANEYGFDMAYDVIHSYSDILDEIIQEAIDEGFEEDSKEYIEYIDLKVGESTEYYWVKIRSDCPLTLEELRGRSYDDFEELCSLYGEKE